MKEIKDTTKSPLKKWEKPTMELYSNNIIQSGLNAVSPEANFGANPSAANYAP